MPKLKTLNRLAVYAVLPAMFVASMNVTAAEHGVYNKITNDVFWDTADGHPIYSQGGGIFKFTDPATQEPKYYWYGVHYKEGETYRANPAVTLSNTTFEGVTCYTSTDLVNWHTENTVLSKDEINSHAAPTWVGRMGVAYLPEAKLYAMFIQHGNKVLVATSDTPAGNYRWSHEIDMTPMIGTSNTGDQTVFTDPDTGKSYLIYSYGRGRHRQYISEIGMKNGKPGLLDCHEVCSGASREGNCMFKYNGRYYMVASNIYGWDGSLSYYVVSDDIFGPYLPANDMQVMSGSEMDYSHVSQTGFFYTLAGTEKTTVIFCGDRWAEYAGNGLGYNQWMPLSFDGTTPHLNSLSSWELNSTTGQWRVAPDNNYVKNGSFEADRRSVPLEVKPRQDALTGWTTEIIKGNAVEIGGADSPQLNYFNTEADRKIVIGEKSLNIKDKIPFTRKVYQEIKSDNFVNIPDGTYTMSAKVKFTPGFKKLYIYADSDNHESTFNLTDGKPSYDEWTSVTFNNIKVNGGKVTIGVYADGEANASCQIDDITFVLSEK